MAWNFRALKGTMEKASLLSSLVTWEAEAPRRKGFDLGHTIEAGYARRKSSLSCYFLLCFSTCLPPFFSLPAFHPCTYASIHAGRHPSFLHSCLPLFISPVFIYPSTHYTSIHPTSFHPPSNISIRLRDGSLRTDLGLHSF